MRRCDEQKSGTERRLAEFDWRPIPNCPGRFVMASGPTSLTPRDLVGPSASVTRFQVAGARDVVVVAPLDDGGVISYERANGTYVHTLNTAEGFARKLAELGIELGRHT